MNILFYHSDVYIKYTPEQLEGEIYANYLANDYEEHNSKFKCIVDFGYPSKMSIRIVESDNVPFCIIHIDYEEYEKLKYLCKQYVIFDKEELDLEGE